MELSDLDWPFFEEPHRDLRRRLDAWCTGHAAALDPDIADLDGACAGLVRLLGRAGWLAHAVPGEHGGAQPALDVRSLCLLRESLAYRSGLADFAFAMQGLGSGPISLYGDETLKARYLPRVAAGEAIAAFALSEKEAGSDVSAIETRAVRDGDHYVLDGEKTWISNGGIASFYTVFARTGEGPGARGLSAFVVDAATPGFEVTERIDLIAPHPLASLRLTACRVPANRRLGQSGEGFKIAMGTLDVFRTTVAAAALGFARRALAEAIARSASRKLFGGTLADLQMVQGQLADMALEVDASALLVYRSAWAKDSGQERVTREAAMAKLYATEAAQRVIDRAVQLFGGLGVVSGSPVERLYREIRALRIYEGASEIQKVIIARRILSGQVTEAASAGAQRTKGSSP